MLQFRLARARVSFVSITLLIFSTPALATNLWQSTFGQTWFYEFRAEPWEVLSGTWWGPSLDAGTTYRISFNVKWVKGRMDLLVGDNPAVPITAPGDYTFDFFIRDGGKRRMLFVTAGRDVSAAVHRISLSPKWAAAKAQGGNGNSVPQGHYISFDRERNLKTEMMDLVERPSTARSDWDLERARELDDAVRTSGIKGMYMAFDWRTVEVGDGKYHWGLIDDNMAVARKYGLKLIIKISDRSFDGTNILPKYFPSQHVLWTSGKRAHGVVARRWHPYVYNRLIRLYKRIASRYANDSAFGGIATTETATGFFDGYDGDYSPAAYRSALTQIATQTQAAMPRGKLFLYLNFLTGGQSIDMNKDFRLALLRDVPHHKLVAGAPDVTPDASGMPRSVTAYRIHARKQMPDLQQFCHLQHVDHGLNGINVKSNKSRQKYYDEVARRRAMEGQSWFDGNPAAIEFDDLRDPKGNRAWLHPNWVLGQLWKPHELFSYGRRNFDCKYVFWHWREWPRWDEFSWPDVKPVVLNNQYL